MVPATRSCGNLQLSQTKTVDLALVKQCRQGDESAWQTLVERYQRLVYSIIRLHFHESGTADDIFQDVWMELFKRLDSITDDQALPAWLMTVTRRKCSQAIGRVDWQDIDVDTLETVDQRMPSIENRFWIDQAMSVLNEKEHTLIQLLYLGDSLSYEEVSVRLDMPVASIGPTRARALQKLKSAFEEDR